MIVNKGAFVKSTINYEDNLYYLRLKVQELAEGLILDLSPDFFLDRFLEDVFFIDSSLGRIYSHLKQSNNLIKKIKYLHLLVKVKDIYLALLQDLIKDNHMFFHGLESHIGEFKDRIQAQETDIKSIQKIILEIEGEGEEQEELITQEELSFLWNPEAEESDE